MKEYFKNLEKEEWIHKTEDWHEELGVCLFLHIDLFMGNFDSLVSLVSCPLSSDFEEYGENYFTHFIKLDFNDIIETMMKTKSS